ncbi:hypothetical protein HPB52_015711 [Rhipicephalus sanguineus]|uniref:Spliceosome-associated protein CWC27 homolog n=1 Tax=Rhipicephalus sanguineus TaxID=34632 RepID=A0A9D4PRM4_RHISA|nr:hypothetical protein HPB52_015711 [Rhipicephalus sanguineus]
MQVLLVTSVGDIEVELWSKEAPRACRNFVQLCMEGYYSGSISTVWSRASSHREVTPQALAMVGSPFMGHLSSLSHLTTCGIKACEVAFTLTFAVFT